MNISAFLKAKTGPLPNWAWASVIVVGLGIGIFVMRRQSLASADQASSDSQPTEDPNANADQTTAGYDPSQQNGHEVIIVPIGDYQTQNAVPPDTQRGSRPSTGSTTRPIPPKTYITIRQRYSINIPSVMDYDKLSPNGIPVRPVPGSSSEVRKQAFGSSVETTGDTVSGPSNVKESGQGSNIWYPVSGGYISGLDVVGTQKVANSVPSGVTQTSTSNGSTNQQNSSTVVNRNS